MKKEQEKEVEQPEQETEAVDLGKLGVMFESLEIELLKKQKSVKNAKNADLIKKADQKDDAENIPEITEIAHAFSEFKELFVIGIFAPIDLFLNDALDEKGINIITKKEISKLLDTIFKALPAPVIKSIIKATKATKSKDWYNNLELTLGLLTQITKMIYPRFQQYKTYLKLHGKTKEKKTTGAGVV